jgi:hypothetical protein
MSAYLEDGLDIVATLPLEVSRSLSLIQELDTVSREVRACFPLATAACSRVLTPNWIV